MNVIRTGIDRLDLPGLLNLSKLTGVGVEVGSARAVHARHIVSVWRGQQLVLVDPWEKQSPSVYREVGADQLPWEDWYAEAQKMAGDFPGRVRLIREYSSKASTYFEDGSLDFVYLDGNHDYAFISEDLRLWWLKVRPGGLFSGHDFYNRTEPPHYCLVEKAVREWAGELGRDVMLCSDEYVSWFLWR